MFLFMKSKISNAFGKLNSYRRQIKFTVYVAYALLAFGCMKSKISKKANQIITNKEEDFKEEDFILCFCYNDAYAEGKGIED